MDHKAEVRVVKQQAKLAVGGRDPYGLLALRIDEVEVQLSRVARTKRAGRAGCYSSYGSYDVGKIVINTTVCHTTDRFQSVLMHELAHAICNWLHGDDADVHGPKWKEVMRQLGQPPERCHSYRDRG